MYFFTCTSLLLVLVEARARVGSRSKREAVGRGRRGAARNEARSIFTQTIEILTDALPRRPPYSPSSVQNPTHRPLHRAPYTTRLTVVQVVPCILSSFIPDQPALPAPLHPFRNLTF